MKILIVDDNPINRRALSSHLDDFGYCDTAENGLIGLEMLQEAYERKKPYELACLDIAMPEMDGTETLKFLREYEKEKGISAEDRTKVLMITAFSDEHNLYKSLADCQGFMLKPVKRDKLLEKLSLLGFSLRPSNRKEENKKRTTVPGYSDMVPVAKEINGLVEFFVQQETENAPPLQSHPDNIDFFKNVITGQMVARLDTPNVPLKDGDGIYFNKDKNIFMAQKSGQVIFKDKTLSLQDAMIINGDVKLQDIDFLGSVEINGDVKDGVNINAAKGIKISGSGGACHLKSEGDIELERLDGKNQALVICGGNFKAKFVYNATVECRNDISIKTEAVDSILKASGNITAGVVTGGECVALQTIKVNRAGSPKDVSTLLKTGHDFYRTDRIQLLKSHIKEVAHTIEHITLMLGPRNGNADLAGISPEKRKQIQSMMTEREHLQNALAGYKKELEDLSRLSESKENSKIIINDILYKGVRLIVNNLEELSFEHLKGPLTLDDKLIHL